jgi:hypothetical protein
MIQIPLPDPREALRALLVVAGCLVTLWAVHEHGRAETAELALDAFAREERGFAREEHLKEILSELLDHSTRALAVVQAEDAELHDRIRTVAPDWHDIIALARVSLEGGS